MPKKIAPKTRAKKKNAETTAPDVAAPEPRAAKTSDDRLALRVAVLEDVVKRAHVELTRRIADVEKRVAAP